MNIDYFLFTGLETGSGTGTVHYLRSVFERGSENCYARHCVLLWRWYLKFEILQGNEERAKLVIYRALSHCPWAKVCYSLLFSGVLLRLKILRDHWTSGFQMAIAPAKIL